MPVPEFFETYSESGDPTGLVPRDIVHRDGLWHQSANVFLIRSSGHLVIQQRQSTKDVCPDLWDLSVAEHLQPGETFQEGARRGLKEELGVAIARLTEADAVRRVKLEIPALGVKDYELQQSFIAWSDAPVIPQADEVAATREIDVEELQHLLESAADQLTPWFIQSLQAIDITSHMRGGSSG